MSSVFPAHPIAYVLLFLILGGTVALGFVIQKGFIPFPRTGAWLLAIIALTITYIVMRAEPPAFFMVALILALLFGMKVVVAVWGTHQAVLGVGEWLGFSVAWFGMRADVFQYLGRPAVTGYQRLLAKGALFLLLGSHLFFIAKFLWAYLFFPNPSVPGLMLILGLFLVAFSLIVHFGLLTLSAGFWRWQGVPVGMLFNAPFKAVSLREFWGHRWNIAFAEMTAIAVYRPLRRRFDDAVGKIGAYVFSGLVHELAISVPVNAGYGLPTAYFVIQAFGAWIEQRFGMTGRLWAMLWVLLPVPILFHPPFVKGIILPLLGN